MLMFYHVTFLLAYCFIVLLCCCSTVLLCCQGGISLFGCPVSDKGRSGRMAGASLVVGGWGAKYFTWFPLKFTIQVFLKFHYLQQQKNVGQLCQASSLACPLANILVLLPPPLCSSCTAQRFPTQLILHLAVFFYELVRTALHCPWKLQLLAIQCLGQ